MSDPQQSWNQPGPQPWGQPPAPQAPSQAWAPQPSQPSWGPQQGRPGWGGGPAPTPHGGGSTPLMALGLMTAVLGLAGAVLPTVHYAEGVGWFSPLFQSFGDTTQFLVSGLVLVAGIALLVVGALVQRSRPAIGTGLSLVGAGVVADAGVGQLLSLLQAAVVGDQSSVGVGGVLLALAGCSAVAAVVTGLVRLTRTR